MNPEKISFKDKDGELIELLLGEGVNFDNYLAGIKKGMMQRGLEPIGFHVSENNYRIFHNKEGIC